jgi:protein-tyrosine phosphatase
VLTWFKKNKGNGSSGTPLLTDIHSHLLPGLDDGVQSFEQAKEIIEQFSKLGYKKLITTPHCMSDAYRNTNDIILNKLSELKSYIHKHNISIELEAAAEYYLDEELMRKLDQNEPLLTFGKKYLLFETNFLTEPFNLKEFIFLATTKGYKPVLAHPERYLYLQKNDEKTEDLLNRGVFFQLNISSVSGYYSKPVQITALNLIEKGWIHFLGSDCHHLQHVKLTEEAKKNKHFIKALSLPLLNNSL